VCARHVGLEEVPDALSGAPRELVVLAPAGVAPEGGATLVRAFLLVDATFLSGVYVIVARVEYGTGKGPPQSIGGQDVSIRRRNDCQAVPGGLDVR
jgi:hypothetical protein